MREVHVTTVGEAHYHNTVGFGNNYLMRIAANRAFIANVKQVLRIPIYGQDELGGSQENQESNGVGGPHPSNAVEKLYQEHKMTFETIKERLYEKYPETKGASSFKDLNKFPRVLKELTEALINKPKKQ